MSDLQLSLPATLVSPDARATVSRRAPAAVHMCLVVSTSPRRAQLWVRAAHEEQWATIVCNTADDAIRQSVRQRIELALVDLQSAPPPQERLLRKLVEQLAARNGPLLAVCGKPDDTTRRGVVAAIGRVDVFAGRRQSKRHRFAVRRSKKHFEEAGATTQCLRGDRRR